MSKLKDNKSTEKIAALDLEIASLSFKLRENLFKLPEVVELYKTQLKNKTPKNHLQKNIAIIDAELKRKAV